MRGREDIYPVLSSDLVDFVPNVQLSGTLVRNMSQGSSKMQKWTLASATNLLNKCLLAVKVRQFGDQKIVSHMLGMRIALSGSKQDVAFQPLCTASSL